MSRKIRIGVQLQPQHADYSTIRDAAVRADEMGVDAIFNWAEVTERAEIGALVTCNSYRNPELLADMARTVDHASDGRLILGIGAGWFERDYEEFGYEFGTPGTRLAALKDALPRIQSRLGKLYPAPTRDIPIMVGGGGEKKTLRYTAEYASIWHGFGKAEVIRHKNAVLDAHCADVGRDPAEIERSVGASPNGLAAADDFVAAGATFITIGFDGRTSFDLSVVSDWLAWRDERNAARS